MIIAANLKTNLTRAKTAQYIQQIEKSLDAKKSTQEVLVFPATSSLLPHDGKVIIGAQNAYATNNGAFTGEIGLVHLEEFNIKTILIGHSERRHVLGETQEEIAVKFNYFKTLGYQIVYCIGEKLETRKRGQSALMAYIETQLVNIDLEYENLIVAYEPVWAIGTGLVPSSDDIKQIHADLRAKTSKPLLYGGSVKVSNMAEIVALDNVDGVLVGGASLYAQNFCEMIKIAEGVK